MASIPVADPHGVYRGMLRAFEALAADTGAAFGPEMPDEVPRRLGSSILSPTPTRAALRRHFSGRIDPFTSAVLVFPLFLTYQIGILAGAQGRNGADYISQALIRLCNRDLITYLQLLVGMVAVYTLTLFWLRRRGRFHPRAFLPMLAESAFYGFFMGGVIQVVIVRADRLLPLLAVTQPGLADILVISTGAGFHEELVFRAIIMAGLLRLAALPFVPLGPLIGLVVALAVSSLLFSLVHHVGPAGEPFTTLAFTYRTLAGVIFGLIWHYRGFAVAAWTHALYDLFVLSLG